MSTVSALFTELLYPHMSGIGLKEKNSMSTMSALFTELLYLHMSGIGLKEKKSMSTMSADVWNRFKGKQQYVYHVIIMTTHQQLHMSQILLLSFFFSFFFKEILRKYQADVNRENVPMI